MRSCCALNDKSRTPAVVTASCTRYVSVPTSWPATSSSAIRNVRTNAVSAGAVVGVCPSLTMSPFAPTRHHTVDFACTSMPRYRTAPSLRAERRCRLDR
jgi:hypothetical protein